MKACLTIIADLQVRFANQCRHCLQTLSCVENPLKLWMPEYSAIKRRDVLVSYLHLDATLGLDEIVAKIAVT